MKHIFYYPPLRIAIIVLALGIGAYFAVTAIQAHAQDIGLVSGSTGTPAPTLTSMQRDATATSNQIIVLLRNLATINLDDSVFRNPAYSLLADQSVTLPAITTQGRRNPFAPLGADNNSVITPEPEPENATIPALPDATQGPAL